MFESKTRIHVYHDLLATGMQPVPAQYIATHACEEYIVKGVLDADNVVAVEDAIMTFKRWDETEVAVFHKAAQNLREGDSTSTLFDATMILELRKNL